MRKLNVYIEVEVLRVVLFPHLVLNQSLYRKVKMLRVNEWMTRRELNVVCVPPPGEKKKKDSWSSLDHESLYMPTCEEINTETELSG